MPGRNSSESQGLVYDDALAIAKLSKVVSIAVDMTTTSDVKASNITVEDVSIIGTTPGFASVRDMEVASGRFITESDLDNYGKVAILGSDLAYELFGNSDPIGETITIDIYKLTVVGVMEERGMVGNEDYDSRLYIPIKLVFKYFLPSFMARVMGDSVNMIYVEVESNDDIEPMIQQMEFLLARRKQTTVDELTVEFTTQQDIITTQESTTAAFRSLLGWVATVSLVVGGIGIMNIMLVSVTERTREIGIRQAVGAAPNDIRWQFLAEALMLSLVGGLLGVAAGVGGSWLFGATSDMRTVVEPSSVILVFSAAALVGIFFGYYPANKAAQLDPIEALRHE
jgi:putative ABC transport system permease protein